MESKEITDLKIYLNIIFRVIATCFVGMLATFLTEELRTFFGDVPCTGYCGGLVDENWDWGARHFWYFWMCVALFILSVIYNGIAIDKLIKKRK